jgi:general secretion pathway protein K
MKRYHRANRGLALVSVLWVSVLLALIAASFTKVSVTEVNRVRNITEGAKAEALADAGFEWALAMLASGRSGPRPRTDGSVYHWGFGDGLVLISIVDEASKLDLNEASDELLASLFTVAGATEPDSRAIAAAVLDYRDEDDTRRPHGAEAEDYTGPGQEGLPKNGPFDLVEELQAVAGMTPELYRVVAPSLSVHSGRSEPEAALATLLLREAMGEGRSQPAQAWKPLDPPREEEDPWPARPELLYQASEEVVPSSDILDFQVEALSDGGAIFVRQAVVQVGLEGNPPYRVKVWRRGQRKLFALPPAEDVALPLRTEDEG